MDTRPRHDDPYRRPGDPPPPDREPAARSGTSTVVAGRGRRYAAGADGPAELRPSGTPAPLRHPALSGVDVGPDGVWMLDGTVRAVHPG